MSFLHNKKLRQYLFDLRSIKSDSVIWEKEIIFTTIADETLTIQLPKTFNKGKRDSCIIYYKGAPIGMVLVLLYNQH